jgi:hypothetical protein
MPDYRFFALKNGNHIPGPPTVRQCASDHEAVAEATKLLDGLDLEIWHGARMVMRLTPDAAGVPMDRPLIGAPHDGSLDPEITSAMGEAFDAVCALLPTLSTIDRDIVAERIIDAARGGERDPNRLRNAGLAALRPR